MANRYELVTEIYNRTSKDIVSSPEKWQSFLSTACYNYRLRFDEQILLFAQRPDATAVLEIYKWNNRFLRWVNRGANSIAVFEDTNGKSHRLKYFFDISDTHETRVAKPVPIWQYKDEYQSAVIETLENTFGTLENKDNIVSAVFSAAENATQDNTPDYIADLKYLIQNSYLEELDEDMISAMYCKTVQNSVAFMMLTRLGFNAGEYFDTNDFQPIVNFNTPETLTSIGLATSDIAEMALLEIARTVRSLDMENRIFAKNSQLDYTKAENKNTERSVNNDADRLHKSRQLQYPEYRNAASEEFDFEQIWADEEEFSQGTAQDNLLQSDDAVQTRQSSEGDRRKSESNGNEVDGTDVSTGRLDGGTEISRPNDLGAENELFEKSSSGNRDERDSLQSVTDNELPPFVDNDLILEIIKNQKDSLTHRKEFIIKRFSELTDEQKPRYVSTLYGGKWNEFEVDGKTVGYKEEKDGLLMYEGNYKNRTRESVFSWDIIAEFIQQLIDNGEYLPATEKEKNDNAQLSLLDFNYDILPQEQSVSEEEQVSLFTDFGVSQQIIDEALCLGANDENSTLDIAMFFRRDRGTEYNADFLKKHYKTNGAGFYFNDKQVSIWYDEKGFNVAIGTTAQKSTATHLTWEQAAKRIRELLDMGRYIPQESIEKVDDRELSFISERIITFFHDMRENNNGEYFPTVQKLTENIFGYPDEVNALKDYLSNKTHFDIVFKEFSHYVEDISIGKIKVYRYNYEYSVPYVWEILKGMQLNPIEFKAAVDFNPEREYFISDDEINSFIRGGKSKSESRLETYTFFINHPDKDERLKYVSKDKTSGYVGGNDNLEHKSKGIFFSHGSILEPYAKVFVKWGDVSKRIDAMIKNNRFLYQSDIDAIPKIYKDTIARKLKSFFSCLSPEDAKPYSDDIKPYEITDTIRKQLYDPQRLDEIEKMMSDALALMDKEQKSFIYRQKEFDDFISYKNGSFKLYEIPTETKPILKSNKFVKSAEKEQAEPAHNTQELQSDNSIFARQFTHSKTEHFNQVDSAADKTLPEWQKEYNHLKSKYPNAIVFYQVGDFFETYADDAALVAKHLDLVITSKHINETERVTMCGFPVRNLDKNMETLLNVFGYSSVISTLDNGVRKEKLYPCPTLADDYRLKQAKDLINNFINKEYERNDGADFSDLTNVNVAYTNLGDNEEHEVQSSVDLVHFAVNKYYDGELVESSQYKSLDELIEFELEGLNFDDLVYIDEDKIAEAEIISENDEVVITPAPKSQPKPRVQTFDLHPEIPMSDRHNYNFAEKEIETVGKKERFRRNINAINVLKECEFENRFATPEEQEILSGYIGWGGIPEAFDENNKAWADEFIELYTVLSPDEYKSAKASTLTAFYTPQTVISAVYKVLDNLGFKQGNILEPSCAIGNFIGMLPENMQDSKMYGIEIDTISAGIAQQLYQKSSIMAQPFEKAELPDSFFDAVVGNVPFGDYKLNDKRYDNHHFLIHDYFFAKSLDKVRPGGILCLVTSKGTMDKESSNVRIYIAQRAELLGAVRLPNSTFRGNAGTKATSDILILQKRDRIVDIEPEWVQLDTDENGIRMNKYFVQHPEMIVGKMVMQSGRFEPESACVLPDGESFEELLNKAVSNIQGEITDYTLDDEFEEDEYNYIPADPNVRNFSYTVVDGKIYIRENSVMREVETSATGQNRIKGMIAIRDSVRRLLDLQMNNYTDDAIKEEQENLNTVYDKFVAKYGYINSRANASAFSDDSSYFLICSLEIFEEGKFKRKVDMFTKRTIQPHTAKTHADTAIEAYGISMGEKAKIDMPYMCQLTGKDEEQLFEELKEVIFLNPDYSENGNIPKYLPADEYLSGNVRIKLRQAKDLAEKDKRFAVNVAALEKVQPVDLKPNEIEVHLGVTWIPVDIINKFMHETFDTSYYIRHKILAHYNELANVWNIENKSADNSNLNVTQKYGTNRKNAFHILESTLNLRNVRVFDYEEDENGKRVAILNKKETAIAQSKQELIRQSFKDWIWRDPERREYLCKLYNEKFNSIRPREYDGSHIVFEGMNPEIALRPNQRNAVARGIYGGNSLLAHCVGAGKTYTMAAIAQESKRLGLCSKSLFVVPNHLVSQWASEYLTLYPSANILAATKKDFETKNRKKFCARIATGDYDAIIIGHSQFEKIPVSVGRQMFFIQEQIDEILQGISDLKENNGEKFTVKQLESTKKKLEAKLEKLNDQAGKDDVVNFEELGVDRLFVDEAHYYKNLFVYSKMRNVGGISQVEAYKSSDMFMKCQYLDELTGSTGITFATGTPISNSMVELYTMQRYLQYDLLREYGYLNFDSWAAQYGETVTAIELTPEGYNF